MFFIPLFSSTQKNISCSPVSTFEIILKINCIRFVPFMCRWHPLTKQNNVVNRFHVFRLSHFIPFYYALTGFINSKPKYFWISVILTKDSNVLKTDMNLAVHFLSHKL